MVGAQGEGNHCLWIRRVWLPLLCVFPSVPGLCLALVRYACYPSSDSRPSSISPILLVNALTRPGCLLDTPEPLPGAQVWVDSDSPEVTILVSNAILDSEYKSDTDVVATVRKLLKHHRGGTKQLQSGG